MGTASGTTAPQTTPFGQLCGGKQQQISGSGTPARAFPSRIILVLTCSIAPSAQGQKWCTYLAHLLKRLRTRLSRIYQLFSALHMRAASRGSIFIYFLHTRSFLSIRLPGIFPINTGKGYLVWRWAVKGWNGWLSRWGHWHSLSIAAVRATGAFIK